jgi:hypothetical protein
MSLLPNTGALIVKNMKENKIIEIQKQKIKKTPKTLEERNHLYPQVNMQF